MDKVKSNIQIVNLLIGPIDPVGESNSDEKIFENLKTMCDLVDDLLVQIDAIHYRNKESKEFSVKRSADYAREFFIRMGVRD